MIGLILAAAVVAPVPSVIVDGSRGWANDRRVLKVALRAPERPRRPDEPRFCFDDALTHPGAIHRVCRSRRDWNRLGLDPVSPSPLQIARN